MRSGANPARLVLALPANRCARRPSFHAGGAKSQIAPPSSECQLDVWHPGWHVSPVAARLKKITVFVPEDLLAKAQATTGEGITPTIRGGLELLAAGAAYERLHALRGRVRFARSAAALRDDRT